MPYFAVALPLAASYLYWVGLLRMQAYYREFGLGSRSLSLDPPDVIAHQAVPMLLGMLFVLSGFGLATLQKPDPPLPRRETAGERGQPGRVVVAIWWLLRQLGEWAGVVVIAGVTLLNYIFDDDIAERTTSLSYVCAAALWVLFDTVAPHVRAGQISRSMSFPKIMALVVAITIVVSEYPKNSVALAQEAAQAGLTIDGSPLSEFLLVRPDGTPEDRVVVIDGHDDLLYVRGSDGATRIVSLQGFTLRRAPK